MSQLRKSASFRSRIPVRRSRLPQRRCCSPPAGGARLRGASNRLLQTNRSFAFEGGHIRSGSSNNSSHTIGTSNSVGNNNLQQHKRYSSSSSFSSSDESYESEAPHQKFIKQSHQIPDENSMYISTDAISLDGLLDSVSSGSFSSPPSPVQYQNTKMPLSHSSSYESLDKYNVALETFKLSDNAHHIPYPLAPSNYYNLDSKHNNNSITKMDAITDDIKKSYYNEKQKQLSDWYYIKNVPKNADSNVRGILNDETVDEQCKLNGSIGIEHHQQSNNDAAMVPTTSSQRGVPSSSAAGDIQSIFTNTTTTSTNVAATDVASVDVCSPRSLKTMNWNNFDCQNTPEANDADDDVVAQKADNGDPNNGNDGARVELKNGPRQARWQFRANSNVKSPENCAIEDVNDGDEDSIHQYDNITPGNCPLNHLGSYLPPYPGNNSQQNCLEHGCSCTGAIKNNCIDDFSRTKFNSTSNVGATGVNVNLLKQRYQQQQQQQQQNQQQPVVRSPYPTTHMGSNEYVNASFRRRVGCNYSTTNGHADTKNSNNNGNDLSGSTTKNAVELQLEHWENISNSNRSGGCSAKRSGSGSRYHGNKAVPKQFYENNQNPTNTNSSCSSGGSSNSSSRRASKMTTDVVCRGHHQKHQQNANPILSVSEKQQQQKQQQILSEEKQRQLMVDGQTSMLTHPQHSPHPQHYPNQHHHHQHQHQHHHHLQQHQQQSPMQYPLESPATLCSISSSNIQQLPPNQNRIRHQQHQQQQLQQQQLQQQATPGVYSGTNNNIIIPASMLSARLPIVATPKAALRSRLIQKRSDETSCSSSFEQLNVIGIPATIPATTDPDFRYQSPLNTHSPIRCSHNSRSQSHAHPHPHHPHPHPHNHPTDQHHRQTSDMQEIYEENSDQIPRQARTTQQRHNDDILDCRTTELVDPVACGIATADVAYSNVETKRRPLPDIPLQEAQLKIFPPKTSSCRSECELSGSYASLECPSPPGPPVCLPESRRDPQARLSTYLRTFYTDLSLKEPIIPPWAIPVAPGALCPARLEPELRLHAHSHGFNDTLTVDQILISLQTKEGTFLEGPRRVLIECPTWASRSNLCLRILHAWAKEPPWPAKGTPVALALFIPLSEAKRTFSNYVEKELLPKGPLNPFASGFGGFTTAWNSLEALGPKLLIILDGYDNQKSGTPKRKGKQYSNDVHDLLDGKLFPEARVIITTSSTNCTELLPIVQRHITYEGLTWGRSASLLGGGQWGGPSRLLDTVQACANLRKAVRTPLGCLAVAAIYEATAGDLPTEELDVVESILNCVAPETSASNVAELGRLALFCLKMKRTCITMAEIRMYCSCPESNIMGCLDKSLLLGKTAKKKADYVYNPMCPGMMEFLAANYIASLVNRPGLLAAEITGLSIGDELDADLLKVIKFAMGLLGERAHILLSRLTPLWLTPQIVFSLALSGGKTEDNLAALCDILGISKHPPISPLEAKPLWVQVRSMPNDLMGWGMALKSPTCTLKNLELIYQLEKHNILDSRKAIDVFLDSIAINESVSTLRVSSLIETEVKDCEISYLANCVSKLLLKPRLENFELVLTLLEEDPPILKLQSVVAALCRGIPRQTKLSFLLLDLGLSTSQLVQICATLEKCPNVTRLSLPHLRCERGAISALSSLLNARPISFLSLPSCWGARDDPPSSSGVSMGSGSGSSTGTSGLIKQGSLPGVPSPRSYAPGIFSSLPRGVFVPPTTLGRSATLPRQPLEQSVDKRSCDSVVSKTWYPTPACDGGPHNSGTLHDLLLAARESYSKLHGLDLSKAQLSLEDSMCLGETVRLSNTLHTLKLEGSSRLSEILPSVLGASESPCLQMLSIGSPRLSLEDSAIAMCARALTSCSTLRLLSLDGWNFRIENLSTLSIVRAFLSLTSIRELSLANCRLQIGLIRSDTKISKAFECRSVVVLKLAGAQVTVADGNILRGPQLLPYIGGFPCLRELDLSAPARSGLGSTHSSPLILDDKCIISFFQHLHTHFGLLNTLKICNWVVHFDDVSRTLKTISKCIRNSPISHLKVDGISVLDRPRKHRIESHFIHCFIASLPLLRWMGISLAGKKEEQITAIGNAVLDLKGYEIDIKLSESTIEHAKLMAQAISLDGKFDIKVSTFGTSSGILIHAEKSGTKSLTRKNKD